jgi:type IV pilus assembly protein PilM
VGFLGEKDFFGLDIGSSAIRLVQLKHSAGRYSLLSYGSTNIPIGLSQSDSSLDARQLAEIIKRLVSDLKVSTKNVVVSLPGSAVFTTVVKMPQMSSSEIDKAVRWQAEQNIPLKIDEVRIDWQLISPSLGEKKEIAVLIVAAPNERVERLVHISESAGLSVLSIETVPIALSRSLGATKGIKTMIVDIGSITTEIAIVDNEILYHTRSLPQAGYAFTRAISQNLGLDLNQAEQFKRKFGLTQEKLEGEIFKTLQPLLDGIIEEIKRSMKFYQEQFGSGVEKIVLSGGSARIPELSSYLSSVLEMNVQVGTPWVGISYPPAVSQNLFDTFAEYSTAVGLAKRQ